MASKDLYEVLGVDRKASQDDIRSTYRKLARKLHPDVKPGDKAAETRFKEITAAYAVLQDEQKRKLYDEFGDVALQAGFDEKRADQLRRMGGVGGGGASGFDFGTWSESFSEGGGLDDILGGLFGGRFGGGKRGARRGQDVRARLEIDLATAVRGGTTRVDIGGRGVDVKIPEGTSDGQTLRLGGLGQPGQAGAPDGDLYVELAITEHAVYRREGDDLHVDVPITVPEAVLGGKVTFAGPTGEVSLKVPPGTQSGRSFRLRGLGVKGKDGPGNLYARVVVVLPEVADDRLQKIARELEALYTGDVRAKVRF